MKKIIFLLTLLISLAGTKALAYDFALNNADGVTIYYNYINNGKEFEVAQGYYSGDVVIPEEVTYMNKTQKVTRIGERAFDLSHFSLNSVTIPNSVTTIGDYAFHKCMSLFSVTIGNNVTSIGDYAFYLCANLTSITLPDCVTSIGDYAFYQCSQANITLGNSVTNIGDYAFWACGTLTSIIIPNSVTSIGDNAFAFCGLTSITIPDNVTSIGERAFSDCYYLTSATIGNSVTSIGNRTFSNCWDLASIKIGESVTTIGEYAFYYCKSLTSITIPNSVTTIGERAFQECYKLTDVICFAETVPAAENDAFDHYVTSATLHVPEASIDDYKVIAPWSKFKSIVAIDSNTAISNTNRIDRINKSNWYSLDGRKTTHPSKGIFIRNGKKELIRSTR